MTVARTGPISAMRAKKMRNASELQTSASTATDSSTPVLGMARGHCSAATGAYATAHRASAAISARGGQPVARRSRPTMAATPTRPRNRAGQVDRPDPFAVAEQRRDQDADQRHRRDQQAGEGAGYLFLSSRDGQPGDADLDERKHRQGAPFVEEVPKAAPPNGDRQQHDGRDRRPQENERRRRELVDGDADEQVRDTPDHAHRDEEKKAATCHPAPRLMTGVAQAGVSSFDRRAFGPGRRAR